VNVPHTQCDDSGYILSQIWDHCPTMCIVQRVITSHAQWTKSIGQTQFTFLNLKATVLGFKFIRRWLQSVTIITLSNALSSSSTLHLWITRNTPGTNRM